MKIAYYMTPKQVKAMISIASQDNGYPRLEGKTGKTSRVSNMPFLPLDDRFRGMFNLKNRTEPYTHDFCTFL